MFENEGPRNVAKFTVLRSSASNSLFLDREPLRSDKIARHVIPSFQFEPDGCGASGVRKNQRTRGWFKERWREQCRAKGSNGRKRTGRLVASRCLLILRPRNHEVKERKRGKAGERDSCARIDYTSLYSIFRPLCWRQSFSQKRKKNKAWETKDLKVEGGSERVKQKYLTELTKRYLKRKSSWDFLDTGKQGRERCRLPKEEMKWERMGKDARKCVFKRGRMHRQRTESLSGGRTRGKHGKCRA